MAILFSDGFETGDFTVWDSTAGSAAIVTSPIYKGSFSANFNNWGSCLINISGIERFGRVYVNFSSWSGLNSDTDLLVFPPAGGGTLSCKLRDVAGVKYISMRTAPGTFYNSDPVVLNKWYCVELAYKWSTSGWNRCWVDGVLIGEVIGNIIDDTGMGLPVFMTLGPYGAFGVNSSINYDDVVFSDEYIGPDRVPPFATWTFYKP
jgi:hypothetical protein